VKQTDLQEREEPKSPPITEVEKKESKAAYPSEVKEEFPPVQSPKKPPGETRKEESKPIYKPEAKKEKFKPDQSPDIEREAPPVRTSEKPFLKKLPEDMEKKLSLPRKKTKDILRSPLGALSIGILLVAGIYAFWSFYSYHTTKPTGPSMPVSEEAASHTATVAEPQEKAPSPSETWELEKIKDLLEKIRRAHLQKNIDLFMSCYSTDFKDREKKERATVKSWENFNYLALSYELERHTISGDTANIRVEWLMKLASRRGGQARESRSVLEAILKKEDNDWKIKEIISVN
jgi:ketosteroid isomerase-like protein